MYKCSRRYIILLEVVIAMAIVALCILPLLSPHLVMLQQQRKFIKEMNLDHTVHLLYVDVLEQLQQNRITWAQIEKKENIPITDDVWNRIGEVNSSGMRGSYRFDEVLHKENEVTLWAAHLLSLTFTFQPENCTDEECQKQRRVFPYTVYVLRHAITKEIDSETAKNEKK